MSVFYFIFIFIEHLYFFNFFKNFYFYFILLYNTVLVLPYIDMTPPVSDNTFTTRHIQNWLFLLWLSLFILSGAISPLFSSSILGTYQPGKFIFQCHFHTVHGVLKARMLKWFGIPFSSAPCFGTLCGRLKPLETPRER